MSHYAECFMLTLPDTYCHSRLCLSRVQRWRSRRAFEVIKCARSSCLRGPGEDSCRGIAHFISCSLTALSDNENFAQNGQLNSLIYWQISGRSFFYLFLKSFKGLLGGLWKIFPSEFSGSSNYLCTLWHFWWNKNKTHDIDFKWFPQLPIFIFVFFFTRNISNPPGLQGLFIFKWCSSMSSEASLKLCVRNRSKCKGALSMSLKSLCSKKRIVLQFKSV